MNKRTLIFATFCLVLIGASCSPASSDDDDTGTSTVDTATDSNSGDLDGGTDTNTGAGCSNIDLLFIIDDSGSMIEEQNNLVANFPKFIEVLDAYETPAHTKVNYRIAVATTGVTRNFKLKQQGAPMNVPTNSKGPDGAFQGRLKCGLGQYPWVERTDSKVSTKFSCMASLGTDGSGYEMPLAALELALGDQSQDGGPNEGFYTKDDKSLLVVIFITDEDDCSIVNGGVFGEDSSQTPMGCIEAISKGLYDVSEVAGFVNDLAGGEDRSVVVGIGGAQQGGCSSTFGSAIYANRLKRFVDLFGDHGVFGDVCSGDLQKSLEDALAVIKVS
ncbi:MAG: hypothetical protein PHU25_15400, partial [Deltaproteobacteria bacterium]|nr:hypothetical protein [Deltaproteobacteria bacterium]